MSMPKTSMKDAWKSAITGSASIGVAASIGMTAGIGSVGVVAGAIGLAASTLAFGFRKKPAAVVVEAVQAEIAAAAEEFDISVETGAPVKAMKTIRLRR